MTVLAGTEHSHVLTWERSQRIDELCQFADAFIGLAFDAIQAGDYVRQVEAIGDRMEAAGLPKPFTINTPNVDNIAMTLLQAQNNVAEICTIVCVRRTRLESVCW